MNENHRILIKQNLDGLVQATDYVTMIKACLHKEVITQVVMMQSLPPIIIT